MVAPAALLGKNQRMWHRLQLGRDTQPGIARKRLNGCTPTQKKVYTGRHRRRTETFPHVEMDGLAMMCSLEAAQCTDDADTVRWQIAMELHCDALPADESQGPESVVVPAAEFLRYLEGASWV